MSVEFGTNLQPSNKREIVIGIGKIFVRKIRNISEILAHVKSHNANTYLVFLHLLALDSLLGLHYH